MGGCCSCWTSDDDGGGRGGGHAPTAKETEMAAQNNRSLAISRKMSAPTIHVGGSDDRTVSGRGLAILAVPLEQDAAYWEWHISLPARTHVDTILFGVASRKDRQFYEDLKGKEPVKEGESSEVNGTNWMRTVEVQDGDVVGVAMQQSDLPMVQFFHNGEPLHELAINRFKGMVHPSICLPQFVATADNDIDDDLKVSIIVVEDQFRHLSPAPKFGPIIVARSIV